MSIEAFEFRIQLGEVVAILAFSPAPNSRVGAIYGELGIEYRAGDILLLRDRKIVHGSNPDDIRSIGKRWARENIQRALDAADFGG